MGGRDRQISEFKVSLDYRMSFRTVRDTQKNPHVNKQKTKIGCRTEQRILKSIKNE